MKLTKQALKRIITEEAKRVLKEAKIGRPGWREWLETVSGAEVADAAVAGSAALERISPEVRNALLLSVPRVLDGRGQGGEGFLEAIVADAKLQNPDMTELEKETIADELRRVVEDAVYKYGE